MNNNKLYPVREIKDLKDMLEQSCNLYENKAAFKIKEDGDSYKSISYRQFNNDIEALGTAWLMLGLENTSIAVFGENRYEWCVTYLSVVNGSGIVVPLDKELPSHEIQNLLERSGASTIVFSGKCRNQIKTFMGSIPTVKYYIDMDLEQDEEGVLSYKRLLERGRELVKSGDLRFSRTRIDPYTMRILIFTSGTTDIAKGVMLSHHNICANITSVCATVNVKSTDSSLSILPLHHTYECTLGFLALLYSGGTITFNEGLRHISKNLIGVKPTMMITVPLLLENIYNKIMSKLDKNRLLKLKFSIMILFTNYLYKISRIDLRKKVFKSIHDSLGGQMRLIIVGAAAVKPEVSRFFRKIGILALQGYGLTECSPLVTGNRDRCYNDNSCGKAIPGVEVIINNPDKNGVGQIIVKGSNVMLGYFQNENATKNCLRDGWFYTGDLGYMDRKGFLHITGRLKNVIVTKNGKKVFPEEVESYINLNPLVQDSLVWGKYDETTGDTIVCAQIILNSENVNQKFKTLNVSKEELMKLLKEIIKNVNSKMPLYKHIREFTIRESEFIRTTTHKIKRYIEEPQGTLSE
jgi:long-chain acyl-CoA synthetase